MVCSYSRDPAVGRRHVGFPRSWRAQVAGFGRDEAGGIVVLSLFLIIAMLMAIGLAVDVGLSEYIRTRLQNTTDAAVLAAADLEQVLTPKAVVEDFFDKAGLDEHLTDVKVVGGVNARTVTATAEVHLDTLLLHLVDIESLKVSTLGAATESKGDIEIALVLDNSGSMGDDNDKRLKLLKPAAKEFVDTVVRQDGEDGTTTISIVPFATQVSAGPELLSRLKVTSEHDTSDCVTFSDSDFLSTGISTTATLSRTAHHDPYYKEWSVWESAWICPVWSSRDIMAWSSNADALKTRIEAMKASGWTSIELGTKWGLALLDPSLRTVLSSMVDDGLVDEEMRGQPFDYGRQNTLKFLVVMSDGENTRQWDIKAPYREGLSPVFHYQTSRGSNRYTYYDADRSGTRKYYKVSRNEWDDAPHGDDEARQLTWPELWADMSVEKFTDEIKAKALGGRGSTYFDEIVEEYPSETKNTRTSQICTAAKNAGVVVFTIGMDTYGQGDATLADCASSDAHFYDVRSLDISSAFNAIARQINQLRLTN